MDSPHPWLRRAGEGAVLAVVYAVAALLGLQLDAANGFATLVWPPTGIAFAALLLRGRGLWPGVWVGALVTNLVNGAPALVAAGIATGNTLEAVIAVSMLRGWLGFETGLGRIRDVVALLVAALACASVSASVGVLSLTAGGLIADVDADETWWSWWLGDVLGALVVAPFILTWATATAEPRRRWEAAALLAGVVVASALILVPDVDGKRPYMLFPVLLVAAVRLGPRGATAATFLATAVAVTTTTLSLGPFVHGSLRDNLTALQWFMGFTSVTFLVTGALVADAGQRRRELRQALVAMAAARAEAERASSFKTNLLNLVSHELRTPLAALILQIERLRVTDDDDDRVPLVTRMFRQSRRLQDLIESLLQQARIQSGRFAPSVERVDVNAVAALVVEEARPQAEGQGLTLTCHVGDVVELSTDPQLLRLILTNLLGNAIKFTPAGAVSLSVTRVDGGCRIDVTDTGPGIPLLDHARVFQPFEQLGHARNKHLAGIGLGLSLVRELTRSLGGTIELVSHVGAGSCFTVRLGTHTDAPTGRA